MPIYGPKISRFTAEFENPEMENDFRLQQLPQDRRLLRVALSVLIVAPAYFLISDFVFFRETAEFTSMIFVRISIVVFTAALLISCSSFRNPKRMDLFVVIWMLFVALAFLFLNSTRPIGFTSFLAADVLTILAFYMMFPVRPIYRLIPAATFTVGSIALFTRHMDAVSGALISSTLFMYIFTNALCLPVAWSVQLTSRNRFAILQDLETARGQIKTLAGMLPICSSCKKIRREEDDVWQSLEQYLTERSDAQLSHSYCPDCADAFLKARKVARS